MLNDTALTGDLYPDNENEDGEAKEAYVYYDVLDQYGNSLRTSTNIEWSTSAPDLKDTRSEGKLTIESPDEAFTYGQKIYVTGVYTKTGESVTKTVEVGPKQALDSVDVAGFVKRGTSEVVETLPEGFKESSYYMVYKVEDQNGNPMDVVDPVDNDAVTFVSDNVLLIKELSTSDEDPDAETELTIDGEEYNAISVTPGMNVSKGGEVTITAIANKTGNKSEFNTVVGEAQTLSSFKMLAPSGTIADGETVEIPFEAYDQEGNEITNFETLASQASFNELSFTASSGVIELQENNDGTAKLVYMDKEWDANAGQYVPVIEWSDSEATDGIDRTVSLTSVVVGGDTDNQVLNIQDKARPESIKSVDMEDVLVEDGSDRISLSSFEFLDQYGRTMTNSAANISYNDGNLNSNHGNVYDNGFFNASEAGVLQGTEFDGYEFVVSAEFSGDEGYLSNAAAGADLTTDADVTLSTDKKVEISADSDLTDKVYDGSDFNLAANGAKDVQSARTGFSVNYEVAKYDETEDTNDDNNIDVYDSQALSTSESVSLSVVDITSVKGYTANDFNKFHAHSVKTGDATGQIGEVELDTSSINDALTTTQADFGQPTAKEDAEDGDKYNQSVYVEGTYNGKTVNVPSS